MKTEEELKARWKKCVICFFFLLFISFPFEPMDANKLNANEKIVLLVVFCNILKHITTKHKTKHVK